MATKGRILETHGFKFIEECSVEEGALLGEMSVGFFIADANYLSEKYETRVTTAFSFVINTGYRIVTYTIGLPKEVKENHEALARSLCMIYLAKHNLT